MYKFDKIYYSYMPLKTGKYLAIRDGRAYPIESLRDAISLGGCGVIVERVDGVAGPGFVDAHIHLEGLALRHYGIDLSEMRSVEEVLEAVKAKADTLPVGSWIYGWGWSEDKLGGPPPTRWELDEVAPNHPVLLVRICGHAATMNTHALRKLGVLGNENKYRGLLELTCPCGGEPTGIVYEDLVSLAVRDVLRSVNLRDLASKVIEDLTKSGLTSVASMDTSRELIEALVGLDREGLLRIRVAVYTGLWGLNEPIIVASNRVRLVGVKVFADGSLGARTARLREPYNDDPLTRGVLLLDSNRVKELAIEASRRRLRLAVHAIGDEALDHVVEGLEKAKCSSCRVEHASLSGPEHWSIMKKLGLWIVIQPGFLVHDTWLKERLGEMRAGKAYQWRAMMDYGLKLAIGSDSPVEPYDPLWNIDVLTTGGGLYNSSRAASIDIQQALHLYTSESAKAAGVENTGKLLHNYYADIVVFNDDPLEQPRGELRDRLHVEEVYLEGQKIA